MTTIKRTDYWRGAAFALLAAGTLLLWPLTALALPTCNLAVKDICATAVSTSGSDCDSDGIRDFDECNGFQTVGSTSKEIAGCASTPCSPTSLDPTRPDVFYLVSEFVGYEGPVPVYKDLGEKNSDNGVSLLTQALNSNPNNPTPLNVYANGLNVRTHRLQEVNCGNDRLVLGGTGASVVLGGGFPNWQPGVRAARIEESISPDAELGYIGSTAQSKPSDMYVASTIYTRRIADNVNTNCVRYPPGGCKVVSDRVTLATNIIDNNAIINYYILQVVSHEMGHGSRLANTTADTYYHYTKSTSTVMAPAATFSPGRSAGIYTIPTVYNSSDYAALMLK